MRKKETFYFRKIKQEINIDTKTITEVELVPGYTIDMPKITYAVISEEEIAIAIITIIAAMQRNQRKHIKLVTFDLKGEEICSVTVKANKKDYQDFCNMFTDILKEDIERVNFS